MSALSLAGRPTLVLASRSPQRRALLEQIGIAFEVRPTDVLELAEGDAHAVAAVNARRKAQAASPGPGELVLGVDTVVSLDGSLYGKPAAREAAGQTLRALSGSRHEVISGVATIRDGNLITRTVTTGVRFAALSDAAVEWYLDTGEWEGRAGAYAIQGRGAVLVESIEGDYCNVVGLPVAELVRMHPELIS